MLSAQTTDKAVNKVTSVLFSRFPTVESLKNAELSEIEDIIKSIGLYKNKAKNIKDLAKALVDEFGGVLPSDKNDLQRLPGIGNKSAGVIRCEVFKIPDFIYNIMRNKQEESIEKMVSHFTKNKE